MRGHLTTSRLLGIEIQGCTGCNRPCLRAHATSLHLFATGRKNAYHNCIETSKHREHGRRLHVQPSMQTEVFDVPQKLDASPGLYD